MPQTQSPRFEQRHELSNTEHDPLIAWAVERAIELHVEIHPQCADLVNDPALLKQMLYHALSNAIK